jgi:hypothetical protein
MCEAAEIRDIEGPKEVVVMIKQETFAYMLLWC